MKTKALKTGAKWNVHCLMGQWTSCGSRIQDVECGFFKPEFLKRLAKGRLGGTPCRLCLGHLMDTAEVRAAFRPGVYQHYKGGMYTAICLVTHHEYRLPYVLYVSHTYGGQNIRPLYGHPKDPDGWMDNVPGADDKSEARTRFKYIGDPNETPLKAREA